MKKKAFGEQKPTPGKVIESFGETTSAHGVPKIIGAPSAISAFLWTLVTVVALGLFCFQGGRLVLGFFRWPVSTKLDVVTRTALRFPAVTICNMNKIRRSELIGTTYEGLIELDGGPRDTAYDWWFSWSSAFYDNWRYNYDASYESPSFPDSGSSPNPTSSIVPPDQWTTYGGSYPSSPPTSMSPSSFISKDYSSVSPTSPSVSPSGFTSKDYSSQSSSFGRRKRSTGRKKRSSKSRVPRQTNIYPSGRDAYDQFSFWQESWDDDFQYYNYYDFDRVQGENDWNGFYDELLETGDFSRWLDIVSPSRSDLAQMGHQPEDFILQCSFDKKNCSYSDFLMFQNHLYGNCFTFNHAANMTVPRETGKTGAQNGLHLTLFVEQPEYIGLLSQETGVRVSINDPYQIPYPEDDGFTVPTGVSSTIGIRQSFIKRLSDPHGNCTDDGTRSNFTSDQYLYSKRACKKQCFQSHLEERCDCVTDITMDDSQCKILNRTQQLCKQLVDTLFQEDALECVCPTPCTEYGYRKTVSSSTWPSERFEPHLVSTLGRRHPRVATILRDITLTRKNLVQLKIYFEELNYESIEQTPFYTVEGLLGGVGGLMGLYVGLSVISLFEIVVFFVRFCKASWYWLFNRERVQPLKPDNSIPLDYNYGYKGNGLL